MNVPQQPQWWDGPRWAWLLSNHSVFLTDESVKKDLEELSNWGSGVWGQSSDA